jgi:sugar lactone lactonase YvrE
MGNSRTPCLPRWALALILFWSGLPCARAASDYLTPPWQVETFAGYTGTGSADGAAATATFNELSGIALDASGNAYIADTKNSTVRKLTPGGVVSTVAGTPGLAGIGDGAGAVARFNLPFGLAAAADGTLFIADTGNHLIRKITSAGVVSTLAGTAGLSGSTDATGALARFKSPTALAYDATAGVLYIADTGNHIIRALVVSSGVVTTLAGTAATNGATVNGSGSAARFNGPIALALNATRTILYVADQIGQTVRQVVISGAAVTTLAGTASAAGSADGTGGVARFNEPKGLALDGAGYLYVSESNGCRIRRLRLSDNQVVTLAGAYLTADSVNGIGTAARFSQPAGLAYDASGSRLLVADALNAQVRALSLTTLAVTTLAGPPLNKGAVDGAGAAARFRLPLQIARDAAGNIYVADSDNHTLRKITPAGLVTTLAGLAGAADSVDGTGSAARFNQPTGVAVKSDGSLIYVSEAGSHVIRKVTAAGVVTTLAGSPYLPGWDNGTGSDARFDQPAGLALDSAGNIYVADFGNYVIRRITPAGVVTTFAGTVGISGAEDGAGATVAHFWFPYGLAADTSNNLYVADSYNQIIRKITPAAVVSTLAGVAGQIGSTDASSGSGARFFYPCGVAVDASGRVYVADYANQLIRRINTNGVVQTIAGTPAAPGGVDGLASAARFRNPRGIAVAADGATLYVSDTENSAIRRLYPVLVPDITSPATATGVVAQSFSAYTITATRFPLQYGASGLPPGLAVNTSTGIITGTPLQAGTFVATLTAENVGGIGTATLTFTIAKGAASLVLANLDQPYDGTAKSPSATTTPPGLSVTYTYNGSSTTPSAYGVYTVVASINDASYQGTATTTFSISAPLSWGVSTVSAPGATGPTAGPAGLAMGPDGALYIADAHRHVVFRRSAAGLVSVFAGGLNAPGYVNNTGTAARFNTPSALAFDASGNLYVADSGNNRIRRISSGGGVTLVAGSGSPDAFDGTGAAAAFNYPVGLAFESDGTLLVADSGNQVLRRIALPSGAVTTFFTSNGTFDQPVGLAVAATGTIYLSDVGANSLWSITPGGTATRIAGSGLGFSGSSDGTGSNALFYAPRALAFGSDGALYVTDTFNHTLRRVTLDGTVTTVAGLAATFGTSDGFGSVARFSGPSALALNTDGAFFVADTDNGLLRLAAAPPIVPVLNPLPSVVITEATSLSSFAFSASGSPTLYGAVGLPPGLALNTSTGQLTGVPLASGIYPVTLSITNALTTVASNIELTVNAPSWEAWRAMVFNAGQLASSAVSGPSADPDGDGVPNLLEYLQGRNPLARDATPALATISSGLLTITYEHLRAAPGWQITPEVSTDVQTWQRGTAFAEKLTPVVLDEHREQVTARVSAALGMPSRVFIRLAIEPVP